MPILATAADAEGVPTSIATAAGRHLSITLTMNDTDKTQTVASLASKQLFVIACIDW